MLQKKTIAISIIHMILIDAFFRFSGIGLMFFLCIITIRNKNKSTSTKYLLFFLICLCATFLGDLPDFYHMPYQLKMFFRFLDVPYLVFLWLFTLSLFQKHFTFAALHIALATLYCAPVFAQRLLEFNFIQTLPLWQGYLISIAAIILVTHTLIISLLERSDDLIEKRRRARIYVLLFFCIITIIMVAKFYVLRSYGLLHYKQTTNAVVIWPAIVWLTFWLADINKDRFSFNKKTFQGKTKLNSRDLNFLNKLNAEVIENKAFLENNLSIDKLAKRLGVSSYYLREFINKTLKHNNFSSYINAYRIESIKNALINPKEHHVPILTIAMNHGFNSLPPFNRAFKAILGLTPTEYRKQHSK